MNNRLVFSCVCFSYFVWTLFWTSLIFSSRPDSNDLMGWTIVLFLYAIPTLGLCLYPLNSKNRQKINEGISRILLTISGLISLVLIGWFITMIIQNYQNNYIWLSLWSILASLMSIPLIFFVSFQILFVSVYFAQTFIMWIIEGFKS